MNGAKYGKAIQRSEYQEFIDTNKENIEKNLDYYRRRQAIVEHPYGTIKRQWGFSYIMTKRSKQRASADVGFIFIAYNLRRIMNILGIHVFKQYLIAFSVLIAFILASIYAFCRRIKSIAAQRYRKIDALRTQIFAKFMPYFGTI